MAGPHSPNHTVGGQGPTPQANPSHSSSRTTPTPAIPATPRPRRRHPVQPIMPVPTRARAVPAAAIKRRLIVGLVLAVALVAVMTVAIVYGVRTNGANTGATFSEARQNGDPGLSGRARASRHRRDRPQRPVRPLRRRQDKRSDQALAKLSSDAFRKQFSEVQVTSIDKIVYLSQYQAQALFSMRVSPVSGGPARGQVQGIAQLLFQRGQIMVCSYVLRTGGSY